MAKLAVTPPVVGSVSTEMYGTLASSSLRQRRRNLRELHQADRAFHHARAAGAGNDDQRLARLDGQLDPARHLFSDHRAHRAADKIKFHRAADDPAPIELAFRA